MNKNITEDWLDEKLINPIMDTIDKVQDFWGEYINGGSIGRNEDFVEFFLFDALNKVTIANNINPQIYDDYVYKFQLLKRASGDIESAKNILIRLLSDYLPQEGINRIVKENFKPTLNVLDTIISEVRSHLENQILEKGDN